jgi:hypothetical protein
MSGNRVEKLEGKVRELEATIDGLTDELVETKERLGAIEDEAGIEPDVLKRRQRTPRSKTSSNGSEKENEMPAETETESEPEDEKTEETADSAGDDIIVA